MKGDIRMLSSGVMKMMLFIMVLSIPEVGGKPMCDPEDNMYYHYQADRCLRCENCLQGEEAVSLEDWDIKHSNPEKGPTECRPCRKCQPGTFSDKRSFKCEPCRNCSLFNQYEVSQCTADSNTICDGVRPTTASPVTISTPKPNHQDKNKEGGSPSVIIAGIICSTIFVSLLAVICVFSRKNKLCQKGKKQSNEEDPETSASVVVDMEDVQPLLSPNSLEHEIHGTNPDQLGPYPASLPTDCLNLGELETDGPSGNPSKRILVARQWSYPLDEKIKRHYHLELPKDQPMTVTEQVLREDGYKPRQTVLELTEKHIHLISKYFVVNGLFMQVARDFEIGEENIEAVKLDYGNNSKETSYQMLLQIKKKRGKITLHELKRSLQNHDNGTWEKVREALYQISSNEL